MHIFFICFILIHYVYHIVTFIIFKQSKVLSRCYQKDLPLHQPNPRLLVSGSKEEHALSHFDALALLHHTLLENVIVSWTKTQYSQAVPFIQMSNYFKRSASNISRKTFVGMHTSKVLRHSSPWCQTSAHASHDHRFFRLLSQSIWTAGQCVGMFWLHIISKFLRLDAKTPSLR